MDPFLKRVEDNTSLVSGARELVLLFLPLLGIAVRTSMTNLPY